MEVPKPLANLISYANSLDAAKSERLFNLTGMLVTPNDQIPLYFIGGFARICNFGLHHCDDATVKGEIQPGVYQTQILPFKDNLFFELTERVGYSQIVRRFRAVPLADASPSMGGNNTALADLTTKDETNLISVEFQLLDPGYDKMRNVPVSDHMLMMSLDQVLLYQLDKVGKQLQLTGADQYRGVNLEEPIDNDRKFKQVLIPPMALKDLPMFLQMDDKFGVYSRGMGSYYRKGMWYIFPPLKLGTYATAKRVVNIYRLPENVFPTLYNTWFRDEQVLTILSTGQGTNVDGSDIQKQNNGTGKRVINSEAVAGEAGVYYAKGQALSTREDSLSEFKTSERLSGEDNIVFEAKPTSNLSKLMTQNAYTDGNFVNCTWHNASILEIEPGMPCRYYYMEGSDKLMYYEGRITSVRGDYQRDSKSPDPIFREHAAIEMFLGKTAIAASA